MRGRLSSLIKFSTLSFNYMQESSERTVTEPSSPPHTALRRCRPVLHRWEDRQSTSTAGPTPSLLLPHCVEKPAESPTTACRAGARGRYYGITAVRWLRLQGVVQIWFWCLTVQLLGSSYLAQAENLMVSVSLPIAHFCIVLFPVSYHVAT